VEKNNLAQSGYDAADLHTLREERLSTEKCLQICAKFSSHIHEIRMISDEAGTSRGSIGTEESPHTITDECLQRCNNTLAEISAKLEKHMQEVIDRLHSKSKNAATSDEDVQDLLTLRDQWQTSRQCLDVCSLAADHLNKSISVIESDSTGNNLQSVVSTRKELLNAKNGALVGGYLSNESVRRISRDLVDILPSHTMGKLSISEDDSTPNAGDVVVGETTTEFEERYGEGINLRTARTPDTNFLAQY
jgi:polyhydroxyalkanoate synthesis regulator phasin